MLTITGNSLLCVADILRSVLAYMAQDAISYEILIKSSFLVQFSYFKFAGF